jgi:hypothetical protein
MALETRSRPRQIVYLVLTFAGPLGLPNLLTHWGL